jgi:hypothetical protein
LLRIEPSLFRPGEEKGQFNATKFLQHPACENLVLLNRRFPHVVGKGGTGAWVNGVYELQKEWEMCNQHGVCFVCLCVQKSIRFRVWVLVNLPARSKHAFQDVCNHHGFRLLEASALAVPQQRHSPNPKP